MSGERAGDRGKVRRSAGSPCLHGHAALPQRVGGSSRPPIRRWLLVSRMLPCKRRVVIPHTPASAWPHEVVGTDVQVPLLDGSRRRYVNLDNAASAPPLVAVRDAV